MTAADHRDREPRDDKPVPSSTERRALDANFPSQFERGAILHSLDDEYNRRIVRSVLLDREWLQAESARLREENAALTEGLREIARSHGTDPEDPVQHCTDLVRIARAALASNTEPATDSPKEERTDG